MQAAQRDPARFAPIYEHYFERIYRYCLRRVNNPQEAEDLTSLIFTRAISGLPSYRGGRVVAWLFRIAHNTVVNHYRSRRPQLSLEAAQFDLADDRPGPDQQMDQAEAWDTLRHLIDTLPDDQRDLLALKITGGLTSAEIGEVVGKRAGTVRVEIHRIIKKLQAQYQKEVQR